MGFVPLSVPVLKPVETRTHNHGYGYSRVGVRIPLNLPMGYPCPSLPVYSDCCCFPPDEVGLDHYSPHSSRSPPEAYNYYFQIADMHLDHFY